MKSEINLTPNPSPASRERSGRRQADRGEDSPRSSGNVKGAARQMRKEPTRSESLLWSALRNRRLASRKFRRQHPVGRFVLDFYCHQERLAVEMDGPVHETQRQADGERQQILESRGIRFLRLPAALVEGDLPAALTAIERAFSTHPSTAERERGDPQGWGEGESEAAAPRRVN